MILVNGNRQDHLLATDRAVQYGDGVFETLAAEDGSLLGWERHIKRLAMGCRKLGIDFPGETCLYEEAISVTEGRSPVVIKIILSRGGGGRGYTPPENSVVTRIISSHDWPAYPAAYTENGIETIVSNVRLGLNPLLAGIKHLNRLEQVLVRKELVAKGIAETVVLDLNDNVIEGSMSNIFLVRGNSITTPSLDCSGVRGIIRDAVLEFAGQSGIEHCVATVELEDLFRADEIFFCNSIAGIWPVQKLDTTEFAVGPISQHFRDLLGNEKLIVTL